jgi:DNA ligase (NAD+)
MKMYLTLSQHDVSKCWEVEVDQKTLTTRWGRQGTSGQSKAKSFDTIELAISAAEKQTRSKLSKGYIATNISGLDHQDATKSASIKSTPAHKPEQAPRKVDAPARPYPVHNTATPNTLKAVDVAKEYLNLVTQVNAHNEQYYRNSAPTISDADWDQMFRRLLVIERDFPELKASNSLTDKVGGDVVLDGFEKHTHEIPMLSLDNAFNLGELQQFFERIDRSDARLYCAEPKMDGLACSLIYEHGQLTVAATRGNKTVGENITANIKTIPDIPVTLRAGKFPARLEVRGEIYMPYSAFEELNTLMEQQGKDLYKNPRNAAAGAIGNHDTAVTRSRKLRFMAYSCHALSNENALLPESHFDRLQWLNEIGIPVDAHSKKIAFQHFSEAIKEFTALRPTLPYGIDGIVFKTDDTTSYDTIGYSSRSPKWAIAYKYPAEEKETVLKEVIWQVGRSGTLSPVAIVEPIDLDGALVSRATLHNLEDINRKNLLIGDTVIILRSGDVIPMIKGSNLSLRPKDAIIIKPPQKCPSCGGPIEPLPDYQTGHHCVNFIACPAQLARRIIHFSSKKCIDIQWLGDAAITEACSKGLITKPADLYDLTAAQLKEQLNGFKLKKAEKIVNSIQQSKQTTLQRFIRSFGIPEIGSSLSLKLATHFQTLAAMKAATHDELMMIDDIGYATATHLVNFFNSRWAEVEELRAKGFTLNVAPAIQDSVISEKSFVVTGTFSGKYSRKEIEATLKSFGVKISGSISSNTHALIYGDKAGSKLTKSNAINEKRPASILLYNETEAISFLDQLQQS